MKKIILFVLAAFAAFYTQAQVKVSILGDSYSTFQDCIPEGNHNWYGPERGNDVKSVDQTWWSQLINDNGLELLVNESFSGATICNTGYNGQDFTDRSFLSRADRLGDNPDIIYVFGGTNDDWAKCPLGEYDGTDMYQVRPAFKAMLGKIKEKYPEALTVVIINTELSKDVTESMIKISEEENVPVVRLSNIDKQIGHPSVSGMKQISSQVWKATAPLLYKKLKGN